MCRLILVAALFLAACGEDRVERPDYVTKIGFRVHLLEGARDYGAQDIDLGALLVSQHFGWSLAEMRGLDTYWGPEMCGEHAGCTSYSKKEPGIWRVSVQSDQDCIADTAWQHELKHAWDEFRGLPADYH